MESKNSHILFTKESNICFLCVFMFFCFMACGSHKDSINAETSMKSTPKIIFLNYIIEKTSNGKRTIAFINKKIVDGKLKSNPFESIDNGVDGDLIFTELDKKSKVLNQLLIKNPLVKTFEYVDDSKQFQTKTITSDKTQFSLRLQLKNTTKYITISNFAENKPLIKTQIN